MNTRSLAKMGPWEQSGHISLVPTLWHRHQRKGKVVWIIFFVKGKWQYVDVGSQLGGEAGNQLAFTFNPGNDLWVHWHVEWMLYHTKAPTVNVLTYQIEAPTGHLNSMRGLRQPGQASHVKDCDNICGPKLCAHQYLPKICRQYLSVWQSSICLSCSPIRSRQSYFVWRTADRESKRSICSLLQHKTIWIWNVLKMMFFSNWFPFKVKIVRRRNLLKNSWPL